MYSDTVRLVTAIMSLSVIEFCKAEHLVFSEMSCASLEPIPESLARNAPENNTEVRDQSFSFPTSRQLMSFRIRLETDNFAYAVNRPLKISVNVNDYFNDFMMQVVSRQKKSYPIVGHFQNKTPRTKTIKCPDGPLSDNTITSDDIPAQIGNLTLIWFPEMSSPVAVTVLLSVVKKSDVIYRQLYLQPSPIPPGNKFDCGIKYHCIRVCPYYGARYCSFHQSLITTIIRNISNEEAEFSIGFRKGMLKNYAAIGITKDTYSLQNMDLVVCRKDEGGKTEINHYYLTSSRDEPLRHRDELSLDNSYKDGDMIWCSFTRVLDPVIETGIDLAQHLAFVLFRGHKYKEKINIPHQEAMTRVHTNLFSDRGIYINDIQYVYDEATNFKSAINTFLVHASFIFTIFYSMTF